MNADVANNAVVYETSKIDGNTYCRTNGRFTIHLRSNGYNYQQYYEKFITGIEEKCYCGQPKTFHQATHTYAKSCGDPKCVGKTIKIVKASWTEEKRTSDRNNKIIAQSRKTPEQKNKEVEKRFSTEIDRYGSIFTKTNIMKDKSKKTKLERYGNEYYAGWETSSKTNKNKSDEDKNIINDKREKTNIERHGISNVLLLPNSKSKSGKSNGCGKVYTMPSGKIVRIRGYENIVLDKLFSEGYMEDDIIIDDRMDHYAIPTFKYKLNGTKNKTYYPDMYIKKDNLIIEVKGRYWYDGNGDAKHVERFEKNKEKRKIVLECGYNYHLWLFESQMQYEILKN